MCCHLLKKYSKSNRKLREKSKVVIKGEKYFPFKEQLEERTGQPGKEMLG